MKSAAYFIGAGVVFILLVGLLVTRAPVPDQAMAQAKAASSYEAKNVLQFPISLTFIRPEGRPTSLFAPVEFSHFDHQNVSCMSCHHTWDGVSEVDSCSAEGCHDDLTNRAEVTSYFRAFHARDSETSCRGCHLKMSLEGTANLPTSPCGNNACHPRERRLAD